MLGSTDQLVSTGSPGAVEFTAIPKQLDAKFDLHDTDSALRATIIETQKRWKRKRQENLLKKAQESDLSATDYQIGKGESL